MTADPDAIVIGSGPNGLVAACLLARAGWTVAVLERSAVAGGAIRTEESTLPGYLHDTCSAFYGLLHASPVLGQLGLDRRVAWRHFDTPVAAAPSVGSAAGIRARPEATSEWLARGSPADGRAWTELYGWWLGAGRRLLRAALAPLPSIGSSLALARATGVGGGLRLAGMMLEPLEEVGRRLFETEAAAVLLASGITHTDLSVESAGGAPAAIFLAMVAQELGMPVPAGGAARLAEALVELVQEAGGAVLTGREVATVVVERGRAVAVRTADGSALGAGRAILADSGPLSLFRDLVGEDLLPASYLEGLRRFRYGSGVFKLDLALRGPVPWRAEGLAGAGVVHLTGDLDGMARSAFETRRRLLPARPLLVVGQQSVADPSRAPRGAHTLWIETHVPSVVHDDAAGRLGGGAWEGLREGFAERVLEIVEEHAPGFRNLVLASASRTPPDLERENPNLVGGDLGAGSMALDQQLVFRPVPGWFRHSTPIRGLYLCSASTHPGGGVHGMGGRNCARRVLRDARLRRLGRP